MREASQPPFRKVLVVDDDDFVLRAFENAIVARKMKAFRAPEKKTAMRIVGREDPDLIIVDLQLRSDSGIDLIKEIRAHGSRATIVLISGYGSIDAAVLAMKAGANDVIAKPLTFKELLQRLPGSLRTNLGLTLPDKSRCTSSGHRTRINPGRVHPPPGRSNDDAMVLVTR